MVEAQGTVGALTVVMSEQQCGPRPELVPRVGRGRARSNKTAPMRGVRGAMSRLVARPKLGRQVRIRQFRKRPFGTPSSLQQRAHLSRLRAGEPP